MGIMSVSLEGKTGLLEDYKNELKKTWNGSPR